MVNIYKKISNKTFNKSFLILILVIIIFFLGCRGNQIRSDATPQELSNSANKLDNQGRGAEALKYYERALPLYKPSEVNGKALCYYNYGLALRRLKRLNEAIAAYQKSLELNPDDRRIYINYGFALSKASRDDEAIALYQKALGKFPDYLFVIENFALELLKKDRIKEAIPHIKKALAIRKKTPHYKKNNQWIDMWQKKLIQN